jgi:D-beta-D-heptose 7-phosphate kinase/D-beta-D-heptose 1-phosphate adenosyltransferase
MKKVVLVTGGFDPLHSGHIEYFKAARELGDKLVVGVNSDAWLERKKGRSFMPMDERTTIIQSLRMVDHAILFNDDDNSAIEAIKNVQMMYPNAEIIFANGGDRTASNIPEMVMSDVIFKFGVGGNTKANSSSWILDEWKAPKTLRSWGYYRVLHEVPGCKVKELTIEPGQGLSMQRHFERHELWHVSEGKCEVDQQMNSGYALPLITLVPGSQLAIPLGDWHRIRNPFDKPCRIVEIQYGVQCVEEDIERKAN